jgi:predicted RNase H-like HicB family nuclease
MKVKIIVHKAEESGYWAEVPGLPGCFSQGETLEETENNIREAIEGYLLAVNSELEPAADAEVYEIVV